ncbi:polysaccharide deacetylase [soil metagenome]
MDSTGNNRRQRWPNGARCGALITVDFDGTGNEVGQGFDPAGIRSAGGYSARRGVPRMLDLFDRHRIPATFFVPGFDAENHPELVREIIAQGHEIGAHGYLHERWEVPVEEEGPLLRKAHDILVDVTGVAPKGWRSPGGMKSAVTLQVLQDLGYIYDSSDKDYDLPYPAIVGGEQSGEMIELPNNTSSLDDTYLYVEGAATPDEVLGLWLDEFDAIYHEGGYFILTFHPRAGFGSGIPSRASVIERLIPAIRQYADVEFMRLGDLAEWCLEPENGFLTTDGWIGARP